MMSWKITLGKPGETYVVGKRWIKKNISKSKRYSKAMHKEKECPGAIYDIGSHYLPDSPNERKKLWVCLETGRLLKSTPDLIPRPKINFEHKKKAPQSPIPVIKKKPKPMVQPKPEPESEIIPEPEVLKPIIPKATKETSVSEIKGIGQAAFDKLSEANIRTIGDLLSRHSQEIATLIGRKSDAQIKKWQETAKEML
jgi:hypothetical protein